ncbi:endoplasmic reticulum protein [Coniella lustricola]|uniref:Endoplasmic reticulum protein n=1 Tax=Coniella lustricola TaxID=2025994 RepID=A0A2T3A396_9PEZI|nr:endoplasmic reticulum protein [Coniella lustricola]
MAPPPPASMPLTQRLLTVGQTLQFAWFIGHLTLLFCIFRYSLSVVRFNHYSRMAKFSYRLAFVAAAVTYGIVVYKTLRARAKAGMKLTPQVAVSLVADENVQYLLLGLVWLLSPQYYLALLPFGVYSVFHVATYTRSTVIPTIIPPQQISGADSAAGAKPQYKTHPIADAIGNFVKEYYDLSMSLVAGLEIAVWIRLLVSAILFQRRSWILIAIYTAFLRARFSQSTHVQNSLANIEARIDNQVGAQGTPPVARQVWDGVKGGVRQFHAATDPTRYAGGAAAPKKTS